MISLDVTMSLEHHQGTPAGPILWPVTGLVQVPGANAKEAGEARPGLALAYKY